jgi:RNase H-like domain found in reverse transcriptase/Reverse transcriptase (RNA-dependent DNA polymerase)/Integrase zinc binding domain/Aspartyl protease/Chromo (CHRromatin Organisation MOdifier) domain
VCCIPTSLLAGRVLEHYAQHKMRSPATTSAVFILPEDKTAKWWSYTRGMKLLRRYAAGSEFASHVMATPYGKSGRYKLFQGAVAVFLDPKGLKLLETSDVTPGPGVWSEPAARGKTSAVGVPLQGSCASEGLPSDEASAEAYAGSIYGLKGDRREARLKHKLLLVEIRILGRRCLALIDSGATHNILSADFVKRHKLAVDAESTMKRVKLANGTVVSAQGELRTTRYRIGRSFTDLEDFIVMDTKDEEFDAILGKPWLSKLDPDISWSRNQVVLGDEVVDAVAQGPKKMDFKVCSLKSALKAAKSKHARAWTVLIRPAAEDSTSTTHTPYSPSLLKPDWKPVHEELKDWPELLEVLHKYEEVFDPLPDGPPKDPNRPKLHIDLEEGSRPTYRPPYRMSPLELDELKKQVQGLLDKGWIRPSHSPFGAPVLFAAKPDGSLRMCIDYRALNAMTKKSRYPLPRIDELFDRMKSAHYITCMDWQQGYHQVAIHPEDIHKTAFVTRYGQFEWLVMPFGLCNAPSVFQAMMNQFLGADLDQFASAYLDDLSIYSATREEHVRHVESVLKRMKEQGYRARLSKCHFGRPEQELLGFIVGRGKIRPSPKKVAAVREWPEPKDVHELRVFLGFTNFYRRFVESYSKVAAPLTELFRKEVTWSWGEPQWAAFQELKARLTSAPALLLPDFDKPFYVVCDASDFALGATLLQDQGNGMQPVAYEGRKMTAAEQRYITTDKENLALVHALRTWRCYLEGRKFTVETDHDALKWLHTQPHLNRRQARWLELLAGYNMEIVHKPGKLNKSDPLSRRPYEEPSPDTQAMVFNITDAANFEDDFLSRVKAAYTKEQVRRWLADHTRTYRMVNGLWYTEGKLVIPDDDAIKESIFKELHDAPTGGHFGIDKTLESIARRFFWRELRKDVEEYCRTCPTCQRAKHVNKLPGGLLQPLPTPSHPWEQVTMDILLNLPTTPSGHNAAIVFVDRLTKYFRWDACSVNVTSEGSAKLYLNNVVRHHGLAKVLISDRDPRFVAGFWQELQRLLHTKLKMSTSAHPQSDGQTENANRTLLRLLRSYCEANPRTWDELLCMAELAYNSHVHASTGVSPFFANYGRHPVMPMDLLLPTEKQGVQDLAKKIHKTLDDVKQRLSKSQERQRVQANRRRRDVKYAVGDKVLLDSRLFRAKLPDLQKLLPPYMGPFVVTAVPGPVNVVLDLPEQLRTMRVVHVSRLKPFHETMRFGDRGAQPSYELIDGEPEWEVDVLLARKKLYGKHYYLVHWKGYDHCEDAWIREDFLGNARELVRAYDRRHPR